MFVLSSIMYISLHMVRPGPTTLLSFFLLILHLSVSDQGRFILVNKCKHTVWPSSHTTSGNKSLPTINFGLKTEDMFTVKAPVTWNGHFWGRTLCTMDSATRNFSCVTGDCGTGKIECNINEGVSPATRAEFRLGNDGIYSYNVNVIEGFNIPIAVTPVSVSGENLNCSSAGCPANLNTMCPKELKVMKNDNVVACQGACSTDNLQKFCCLMNNFSTVETCDPSAYSLTLKTACPRAYSFPYDNVTNTFSCSSKLYKIVFCPASSEVDSTGSLDESVNVGDSLTAGNGTTRWLSSSGEFAFGFYQLPNELFLVAIWYDKIQNDSIIWYVNGDSPAPKGSRLVLNDLHGLVLINPKGLKLWRSSYFTSSRISRGLMKDDGNFQLQDQNFVVLWESFRHSTDTLVPGQELNPNDYLYSRQGESNFSRGRFDLRVQKNGDVVLLNRIDLPTNINYNNTQHDAYYDSGIVDPDNESSNVGKKLIFDKFGFLYILKRNGEKLYITNPNETVSNDGFYYKATINYDGVFTLSYYPRYLKNGQSWVVAKTIPENICLNSTFNNGQGICGLNSICSLRDEQRPMCTCLEGYTLIDSNNMYGGCIPNFQVMCPGRHQGSENATHVMIKLSDTYWPKSDYETLSPCSLEECKESCLQDCLCVLVFFNESSCWKKKLPLSHGRKDVLVKGISIMKMKKNDTLSSLDNKTKKKKGHDTLIIVISILLGISVVIIVGLVCTICFGHNHKIKSSATNKSVVN